MNQEQGENNFTIQQFVNLIFDLFEKMERTRNIKVIHRFPSININSVILEMYNKQFKTLDGQIIQDRNLLVNLLTGCENYEILRAMASILSYAKFNGIDDENVEKLRSWIKALQRIVFGNVRRNLAEEL